jgi:hypothetical protein
VLGSTSNCCLIFPLQPFCRIEIFHLLQQHVIGLGGGLGCCGTKHTSKEVQEEEVNG